MNDTNLINEFKAELVRQEITIQIFIKENLVRHRRRVFDVKKVSLKVIFEIVRRSAIKIFL